MNKLYFTRVVEKTRERERDLLTAVIVSLAATVMYSLMNNNQNS